MIHPTLWRSSRAKIINLEGEIESLKYDLQKYRDDYWDLRWKFDLLCSHFGLKYREKNFKGFVKDE